MRKLTVLLAVTVLTTSTVGCGCCRRLRDTICRGAYCGAPSAATPPPAVTPAPAIVPQQQPAPQPAYAPQPTYVPQPTVTQCVPCMPCCPCDPCDPCSGYGYGYGGYGYGAPVTQGAPVDGGIVESPWATSDEGAAPTPASPPPTLRDEGDPGPSGGPSA